MDNSVSRHNVHILLDPLCCSPASNHGTHYWSTKLIDNVFLQSKIISKIVPDRSILINCKDCKTCSAKGKLKCLELKTFSC